tara:strand:- start:3417 stop:3866 length:450 start_codon:yes stop_codon:yes gene_type:complete
MNSKKIWGNAVWYLFHTLAYKLKNKNHIPELVVQIKEICNNLPCEICKAHSLELLKQSNINNINDKNQLINFLFEFHNLINKKIGNPIFTIDQHNQLYSRAKTVDIIKNFINVMKSQKYNEKRLLQSYYRNKFIKNFIKYIDNNINEYT